ncbi:MULTISPECIES: LLM class flavin-dependent oxidoreductase [unclassified Pseudonocardia]|uniref:LLM class flavin-dependent oxidoreductase n=1 Tax=unclassified Pseudonocardia TaxID=2619320 RepID=UPI000492A63A|nr:LLM class flavin-dependent oxidoreductase [Pseudonocardia sp. Ae707_Ps1]OLM08954.1 Limonene 1,2-monooxygenase [Pseudonocardia sp. Ae707_Ps1]
MTAEPRRMRFGVFQGPYHRLGVNPNLAMRRDLELAAHLDRIGFDEIWFGEHHSGGVETIASPEVMIAAAAQHTTTLKLGTGVASLPYHQPFVLADRIIQLDHLTRGRMMFGVGPGQLLEDATMLGIEPSTQRARMQESLEVILRLFAGETVTAKTEWFTLQDAVLQLPKYSNFEIAVTGAVSATGPALAGRYGTSLLSLAATDPTGIERLAGHWDIVEEESMANGHSPSRDNWRLLGPMYIAETVEQAKKDVAYGLKWLQDYLSHITPTALGTFDTVDELVDALNESGRGVIGTPEMAVEQLTRLQEKSGGFGTYLFQGSDYARFPNTLRSYELFAEEVIPRMNGQLAPVEAAVDRVLSSGTLGAETTARSQAEATARYQASRGKRG